MSHRISRILATLLIDDWPLPRFLRRRIELHPDVAVQLRKLQSLEHRLRTDASEFEGEENVDVAAPSIGSPSGISMPAGFRRRRTMVGLAVAASSLFAILMWRVAFLIDTSQSNEVLLVEAADIRPVLASLSAGKEIAGDLSEGLQELGVEFAEIAQFKQLMTLAQFVGEISRSRDIAQNGVETEGPSDESASNPINEI